MIDPHAEGTAGQPQLTTEVVVRIWIGCETESCELSIAYELFTYLFLCSLKELVHCDSLFLSLQLQGDCLLHICLRSDTVLSVWKLIKSRRLMPDKQPAFGLLSTNGMDHTCFSGPNCEELSKVSVHQLNLRDSQPDRQSLDDIRPSLIINSLQSQEGLSSNQSSIIAIIFKCEGTASSSSLTCSLEGSCNYTVKELNMFPWSTFISVTFNCYYHRLHLS